MGWLPFIKDVLSVAKLRKRLADSEAVRERLTGEIAKLRDEVADLRTHEHTQREMHFDKNAYWRRSGPGQTEGPFCPKCFDGDHKPVRLSDLPSGWWSCPVCNWAIRKSANYRDSGIGRVENEPDDLF